MPISFSVRATRIAISPRFAIRTFWNTAAQSNQRGGGAVGPSPPLTSRRRRGGDFEYPSAEGTAPPPRQGSNDCAAATPSSAIASPAQMLIELQSHSTVSDGQLAPGEVVAQAWEAGVTTLALTDHDAVAGVEEAAEAAKGFGIELVPAIEMSCVHEYAEDLHICGYWIDLATIKPVCERAQKERINRAEEIIQRLRNWGFEVKLEDAIREAGDALSIGRPPIARAAG